jgi:hypothetical protein
VYATPGVSELITIGDEVEVPVRPPGFEVAIYVISFATFSKSLLPR